MELKQGMNLGGWFSQCVMNEEHYEEFASKQDMAWIALHGFDHVRVPVDFEFLLKPNGDLDRNHMMKIHEVIRWCSYWNLSVVIDLHKAPGYDFMTADKKDKDPLFVNRKVQRRFCELWEAIAREFGEYDNVAFELLNEVVNPAYSNTWNRLVEQTTRVIRKYTKDAPIIYGGVLWNSAKTVKLLKKPKDRNVMFTFHYYEPMAFTHQKASWIPGMDPDQTAHYPDTMAWYREHSVELGAQGEAVMDSKLEMMNREFHREFIQEAVNAAEASGVTLYCGEFGVIDCAPVEDTVSWYRDAMEVFREYGIGYACWTYKDNAFGLTGTHYDIVRALLFPRVLDNANVG